MITLHAAAVDAARPQIGLRHRAGGVLGTQCEMKVCMCAGLCGVKCV